jgi:hypothetical protein
MFCCGGGWMCFEQEVVVVVVVDLTAPQADVLLFVVHIPYDESDLVGVVPVHPHPCYVLDLASSELDLRPSVDV